MWNPSSQDKSREIVMEDVVVPAFEDVDSVPEVRNQTEYVRVPDTDAAVASITAARIVVLDIVSKVSVLSFSTV